MDAIHQPVRWLFGLDRFLCTFLEPLVWLSLARRSLLLLANFCPVTSLPIFPAKVATIPMNLNHVRAFECFQIAKMAVAKSVPGQM